MRFQLTGSYSTLRGTASRADGLRGKWNLKSIMGYTDAETVMVDLDNMPFKVVKKWAMGVMKRFRLKGFIILKTS